MIVLPPINNDEGLETRMLIAEVRGPFQAGYNLKDATTCMQWMHIIVQNRMANPKPFGASDGTMKAVITAHGQFAGFENYPTLSAAVQSNIDAKLLIANAPKDKRTPDYASFIQAAIDTAKSKTIADPSPGKLTSWRTAGHSGPGKGFNFYKTLLGNDFYYQD